MNKNQKTTNKYMVTYNVSYSKEISASSYDEALHLAQIFFDKERYNNLYSRANIETIEELKE